MSRLFTYGAARAILACLVVAGAAAPRPTLASRLPAPSAAGIALSPADAGASGAALPAAPADTVHCTADPAPRVLSDDGSLASGPIRGGQQVIVRARHVVTDAGPALLLLTLPRARRSANMTLPVTYSPSAVHVVLTAAGTLVDGRGAAQVAVTLPRDAATGMGLLRLVVSRGTGGVPTFTVLRSWRFPVVPAAPAILVHSRPGARVQYETAFGSALSCAGTVRSSGVLLLAGVPPGVGHLQVADSGAPATDSYPSTSPGEITEVQQRVVRHGLAVAGAQAAGASCDTQTGTVLRVTDTLSGVKTATSGNGPFGVFIAGIGALDTFTAQLTRIDALGTYRPIEQGTPVQAVLLTNGSSVPIGTVTRGPDSPGAGTQASPGLTTVTLQFDTSYLTTGASTMRWQVGSGPSACTFDIVLNATANPAGNTTSLGGLQSYFSPLSHNYEITGVVPSAKNLKWLQFVAPIDLSMPGASVGSAQLQPELFQNWINEGDIGIAVHETIHTDGSWSGTLSGHVRVILLNHTEYNDPLPTFTGSGASLTQGTMTAQVYKLVDVRKDIQLYNTWFYVPEISTIVSVSVRLTIGGTVTISIGVPATLDAVKFTLLPTVTFTLHGSGTAITPLGTIGAAINGNIGMAAPISLQVPTGGVGIKVGVFASVTATLMSSLLGNTDVTILPQQCLGTCTATLAPAVRPFTGAPTLAPPDGPSISASASLPASLPTAPAVGVRAAAITVPLAAAVAAAPVTGQPALAVSAGGTLAALWRTGTAVGTSRLMARIGSNPPVELARSLSIDAPQVVWTGPQTALALWSSTDTQMPSAVRAPATGLLIGPSAAPGGRHLYSAVWHNGSWTAPALVATGSGDAVEPALAAGPHEGEATAVWLSCAGSTDLDYVSNCILSGADLRGGIWQRPWAIPGAAAGAASPAAALDAAGHLDVSWLAGRLGDGHVLYARRTAGRWSAPAAVAALPDGVQHQALADGAQHEPVIAVESHGEIWAAQRTASGIWHASDLGAGTLPRLVFTPQTGTALLAGAPGDASVGRVTLSALAGSTWSVPRSLAVPAGAGMQTGIAADPRDGSIAVVTAGSPDQRDALRLRVQRIAPGSAATLAADGITLSDAHPRAGAQDMLHVQVRNQGATAVPAGMPITVEASGDGATVSTRVVLARALAVNGSAVVEVPVLAPKGLLAARVESGGKTIGQALLGRPEAPTAVKVSYNGSIAQVTWTPGQARGVTEYAVYQQTSSGAAPSLLSVAGSTEWEGAFAASAGMILVSAIDDQGRVSLPAAAQ